jgi:hypothetical protein
VLWRHTKAHPARTKRTVTLTTVVVGATAITATRVASTKCTVIMTTVVVGAAAAAAAFRDAVRRQDKIEGRMFEGPHLFFERRNGVLEVARFGSAPVVQLHHCTPYELLHRVGITIDSRRATSRLTRHVSLVHTARKKKYAMHMLQEEG